jgi:hypothetical protein
MDLTERAPRPIRFHLAECKRFARVYLILYGNARARALYRNESRCELNTIEYRLAQDADENHPTRCDSDFEFIACDYSRA